jgi:predicted transposase YbfD/YdcC
VDEFKRYRSSKMTVEEKGNVRGESHYFITSLTDIKDFAYAVRKHWLIEKISVRPGKNSG